MRTICTLSLLVIGCATAKIPNTDIQDTPTNRAIVNVVEGYRSAVESKDVDALKALTSKSYYENASSTWTTEDDWGHPNLGEVLKRFSDNVKAVRYDIRIQEVQVSGKQANVDYEHTWAFQYTDGEQDHWTRKTDVNRLVLIEEDGAWRIRSGM